MSPAGGPPSSRGDALPMREGSMVISSRTPEGMPYRCPVCGTHLKLEPSQPDGDAPCPDRLLEADSLERLLARVVVRRGMTLTLDLVDVEYISTAALGALLKLKKTLAGERAKLRLRGLDPGLREVFRI